MAKKKTPPPESGDDPSMIIVRALCAEMKAKKMTQEEIGVLMGYDPQSARKSVNQFLNTKDPRISMLRRFAKAMGVALAEIVREK